MTIHYFAMHIGLHRSENLYHIKRGNYGISNDLADRIVKYFPEINRTWLLTGVGSMLSNSDTEPESVPYYDKNMEEVLPALDCHKPTSFAIMPFVVNCDLVIKSFCRAMSEPTCAVTELFLKRVDVGGVIQGNDYVLIIDGEVIWRKVRLTRDRKQWRLVARNRKEYDDIIVSPEKVSQAWRVIAKMAIMAS